MKRAYRNELRHGDLRQAPEALRLINSGFRVDGKRQPEAEVQEVEIGRYYGDATQGNLRVAFNERTLHPFQPYDTTAMANQLEYFQKSSSSKVRSPVTTKSGTGRNC